MIYQTQVSNRDGIKGKLRFSDNQELSTKHPLTDDDGYNPEQLIASAWATCLNATIQALLEAQGIESPSAVDIAVSLCKEESMNGYYFQVDACAAIKDLPLDQAEAIVQKAHQRCPVSKLLSGAKTLTLKTVAYQE